MQIKRSVILLSSLALLIAVPWIASDYFVMMCIRVMYFGMLTLSLCFLAGELENYAYPAEAIAESLAHLPKVG